MALAGADPRGVTSSDPGHPMLRTGRLVKPRPTALPAYSQDLRPAPRRGPPRPRQAPGSARAAPPRRHPDFGQHFRAVSAAANLLKHGKLRQALLAGTGSPATPLPWCGKRKIAKYFCTCSQQRHPDAEANARKETPRSPPAPNSPPLPPRCDTRGPAAAGRPRRPAPNFCTPPASAPAAPDSGTPGSAGTNPTTRRPRPSRPG